MCANISKVLLNGRPPSVFFERQQHLFKICSYYEDWATGGVRSNGKPFMRVTLTPLAIQTYCAPRVAAR